MTNKGASSRPEPLERSESGREPALGGQFPSMPSPSSDSPGLGGKSAALHLVDNLQHADENIRLIAALRLASVDDRGAVDILVSLLSDPGQEWLVRLHAANGLGNIGDLRAVDALLAALDDESFEVRGAAIKSLGLLGDARAVHPLIAALHDSNLGVSRNAAEALVALGSDEALDALIDAIAYGQTFPQYAATRVVADARAVDALIANLRKNYLYFGVRLATADALGRIGDPRGVDALAAMLQHDDMRMRGRAAIALGQIAARLEASEGTDTAVEALSKALSDDNLSVRAHAANALHRIDTPAARDALTSSIR